jgi:hypothetical protein
MITRDKAQTDHLEAEDQSRLRLMGIAFLATGAGLVAALLTMGQGFGIGTHF